MTLQQPPRVPLPPGKEAVWRRARRHWRAQSIARRIAWRIVIPLLVAGGWAGYIVGRRVGTVVAFDIFVGSTGTSSHPSAGGWGVFLGAVGYLMVPAVASLIVGEMASRVIYSKP